MWDRGTINLNEKENMETIKKIILGSLFLIATCMYADIKIEGVIYQSEERIADFVNAGRPVFVFFHADWCGPCQEFKKTVLSDPEFLINIARFNTFEVDLSNTGWNHPLVDKLRVMSLPTVIIFINGKVVYAGRDLDKILKVIRW